MGATASAIATFVTEAAGTSAGAGSVASASAAATAIPSVLAAAGTAAATAGGTALVTSALSPQAPKAPGVTQSMPDPLAQEKARQRAISEQIARRGRDSTVMTAQSSEKLGG